MFKINGSNNELLNYIETSIEENYVKKATYKNDSNSKVILYQNKNNNKYIIKRFTRNLNDDVFRILKNQRHNNIVQIYEVCADEQDAIIVLEEYVEGKTLSGILSEEKTDKKTACGIAVQICDALIFLHSMGIVHRDIKPENIIVKDDGTAVLIDFSIARLMNNHDKDTQALGTPGYAAPEQFGISQSGSTTDIYSLGILLNIMLTGVHPSVDLPKGLLRHIIKKCTNVQISKRYSNAKKLKRAIQTASKI